MVQEKNDFPNKIWYNCQSTIAQQLADKSIQRKYVPMVTSLLMTCWQNVSTARECKALWVNSKSISKCFQLCSSRCKSSEELIIVLKLNRFSACFSSFVSSMLVTHQSLIGPLLINSWLKVSQKSLYGSRSSLLPPKFM